MARVRQYTRSLDAMSTKFDFSQISTFNREEMMIKQEPCNTDNVKMNDNHVSTNTQCEYINLTKNNSNQEKNVPITTENLSNDVITSRIRVESISTGNTMIENVKHVQRKKRSFVIDENNKNDRTLEKNDNINRSNNRLRKNTRQIQNRIHCDICSLSFTNLQSLNFHKNYYLKNNIYFCKSCSSNSCYHIKEQNNKKVFHDQLYKCHFCEERFFHKEDLQAHLLHKHTEEINRMNVLENDKLMINHSIVSHSVTPIKNIERQQKISKEREKEEMVDENTYNSNVNTCEILTTIKRENNWRDNQIDKLSIDQIVSNVPRTTKKPKENRMRNQPFVKIHVDKNMMEALLRISDNNLLDESLPYVNNINSNINSNNKSNNNIIIKPYALRSLNNSKELNNRVMSPKVVQKNDQRDDKLSKHLNVCKKCIIPLVKCDNIVNVTTPIRSTSNSLQFNTLSSHISRSSRNRKSIKRKLIPTKRKTTTSSAFNNCTPQINQSKDLITIDSSIEEPPMKIIRSRIIYSPLKLPRNNAIIHHKKKEGTRYSRKKVAIKQRLVINRRILERKLERSLKKNNINNSKVSSTVEKLDTEVLENNKLMINNVKLKEVTISLVKLPEFKTEPANIENEIIPNETFPCEICNSSLASEKDLKKHIRKCHTAYISSICRAKYTSKRLLLKHYLKEHDSWTSKCCVCHQFLSSRLLLKQHLLLHCIKITLSKTDATVTNKNIKCSSSKDYKCKPTAFKIILKMPKSSKKRLRINYHDSNYDVKPTEDQKIDNNDKNNKEKQTEHQEIDIGENNQEKSTKLEDIYIDKDNNKKKSRKFQVIDNDGDNIQKITKNNFNVNNVENMTNQVNKSKENDNADVLEKEKEPQTDPMISIDLTEQMENNNTEVPLSGNIIEESILDPLQVVSSTFTICNPNENSQTEQTLNISNSIQPSVNNNNEPLLVTEVTKEKKKYPCSICKQSFQKLENLQQHQRTYFPSFNYFCSKCALFFSNKRILKNHINATHDSDICNSYKFHCQFCNHGFHTQNNLRIHELHYHATAVTVNNKKIMDFLQISKGENSQQIEMICKVCGLFFNTVERYQLHRTYFYKDHIFPCKFCDKIFHGLYMIHHHNKLFHHYGDSLTHYKYKCINCYEGFPSEIHLQAHMSHVHPDKQEKISPLNTTNHNQTNKSYVCSKCNIEFFTVNKLLMHIEHFSNHGNYKCSKCSRKCYNLSILNDHMSLTHFDNGLMKRHICAICGEVLISKTSLLCHQKHVHDDIENEQIVSTISCEYPKTDSRIEDITDEDILVIDNEPVVVANPPVAVKIYNFCCPICGLKFEKEIYLKEHLAEYLDYGEYQCNKCQRRFANSDFLKKHLENHLEPGTPTSKYYCIICKEICKSSVILESHVAHLHARIIFKDVSSKDG